MTNRQVTLELSGAEALVLYDFLTRFSNTQKLEIKDHAEERVLWDLQCSLEKALVEPFEENYSQLLSEARAGVRDER